MVRVHPPLPGSLGHAAARLQGSVDGLRPRGALERASQSPLSSFPAMDFRLSARGRRPAGGWAWPSCAGTALATLDDGATRSPGAGRQGRREVALIVGHERVDREVVRIERPGHCGNRAGRPRIRRGSVELGQCDVLLIDGQRGNPRGCWVASGYPAPIGMIASGEYRGMVRMAQIRHARISQVVRRRHTRRAVGRRSPGRLSRAAAGRSGLPRP